MKPFTLSAFDLREFLLGQGIPDSAIKLRDTEYVLPTSRWVTEVFAPWFERKLISENYTYRPNSRDCDKFARKAAAYVGDCNAVTEERAGNVIDELGQAMAQTYGIAFAEIKVVSLRHSINAAIHRPDKKLVLVAYEPQLSYGDGLLLKQATMRVKKLTQEDWNSCNDFDI